MRTPAQRIGDYYETLAVHQVLADGLTIVACNYHAPRLGEIDIIATQAHTDRLGRVLQTLVFIEVRARKLGKFANGVQSITPAKQRKIIRAAQHFVQHYPEFTNHDCRFDVMVFDHDGVESAKAQWLRAAFLVEDGWVI